MSENLLWLLYFVSGAFSFAGVFYGRWHAIPAIIAGGLLTACGWIILFMVAAEDQRPDWVNLDLSLNICFGTMFAAGGAALAGYLLKRQGKR